MNDPYKTLNISRYADDDEIKQAYRKLAKKYHPDRYQDSELAKEAAEKMKEINQAYDMILRERKNGNVSYQENSAYDTYNVYTTSDSNQGKNYYSEESVYDRVYTMIDEGRFTDAQAVLGGIPSTERDAEWYYIMGMMSYKSGWLEEAYNYTDTACRMDPTSEEYRTLYEKIASQRSGSEGGYQQSDRNGPDCLDCLSGRMCAECVWD